VWAAIATARWQYIAANAAISSVTYFLRSLRWRLLLNAEGSFSVGTVFWANMAGYLGNNFLPARAGEVIRSVLIGSRAGVGKAYALTTALGERLIDAIVLVLWGSLLLLGVEQKPHWMGPILQTMAAAALAGGLAIAVLPHAEGLVRRLIDRAPLPERFSRVLLNTIGRVMLGLRAFHDWRRFGGFIALTVIVWVGDAVATIVGARAFGMDFSFRVAMLLLAAMGLSSALPSAPGYVGVYQFVAVEVLTPFGFSRDQALAFILVIQAAGYVVVLLWGLPGLIMMRRVQPVQPSISNDTTALPK
jgi:uncharacterized protein (TIRG00374 family)